MAGSILGELGRPLRPQLSLSERAIVAVTYVIVLALLLLTVTKSFSFLTSGPLATLFVSFALMLLLGNYVLEPFFARPADVFVNSIALLLALQGMENFFNRNLGTFLFSAGLVLLALAAFLLLVIPSSWSGTSREFLYRLTTRVGRSKVVFTVAYVALVVSYFSQQDVIFWLLLGYILLVLVVAPVELIVVAVRRLTNRTRMPQPIGRLLQRIGDKSFRVAIPFSAEPRFADFTRPLLFATRSGTFVLAAPLSLETTATHVRLDCRLIFSGDRAITFDAKTNSLGTTPPGPALTGDVFQRDLSSATGDDMLLEKLADWPAARPVGLVAPGTDSSAIVVDIFDTGDSTTKWEEGLILNVEIGDGTCLIQAISAESIQTPEDDSFRGVRFRVTCAKLGSERRTGQGFDAVPWVPAVSTPVYLATSMEIPSEEQSHALGHVPGIEKPVSITDPHKLVTHNSAILGALGSGKTSLAMALARSIIADTDVRIISIDLTEEHDSAFGRAIGPVLVATDQAPFRVGLAAKADYVHLESRAGSSQMVQIPSKSGNVVEYRANTRAAICQFLFDAAGPADPANPTITGTKRVFVIDPNQHEVTHGEKVGFQVATVPLSAAEKTRIIAEELLSIAMKLGLTTTSRLLLILEEAHTLVPEFTFVAQEGDKTATNGTARVILQGRKYGLGAMVIAQRSANVSKSILSQCSTVFALRIFDDTGKAFVANFIGSAFADSLPQLPPFHAVVVGAGLETEQPLMIRLRDPSS